MSLITGIIKPLKGSLRLGAFAAVMLLALSGCGNHGGNDGDDDDGGGSIPADVRVPVNVTSPRIGNISESDIFNATTVFLLNDVVRSPISGYVTNVDITPGQFVKKGDVLFSIQSKEAAAIPADSLFPSHGIITVKATKTGIVKKVERQQGDYMQDGDSFCTIADNTSLVFMLDVPFELRSYIKPGEVYTITLPDKEIIKARIESQVPEMDRMVQMEKYVLQPLAPSNLPEGLIGTVIIPAVSHSNAVILPKSAVLTNETEIHYWVMKVINDSVAVRVNIEKGLATKDSVEIKSPVFSEKDKILVTGNYGVPDTLKIKIIKP